jgi:hypothetical protein
MALPKDKLDGNWQTFVLLWRAVAGQFAELDTLPKDILPTDVFPNGHFAEWTFCRTDSLPKIEIYLLKYNYKGSLTRSKFL